MVSAATSSVVFVRALVRGVIGLGGKADELFAQMGITEADLADPDARLPAIHNLKAWQVAEALTGDPLFGLHLAQHAPLGAFGVLDWATRSASSIEHGLRQTVRYFRVLTDLAVLALASPGSAGARSAPGGSAESIDHQGAEYRRARPGWKAT